MLLSEKVSGMDDPFVKRLQENEKVLSTLSDNDVIMLALSDIILEMTGKDTPPGIQAKRITLSADLNRRAGVKF